MTHSAGAGDLDAYVSTMHKMSALLRVSNFFGTSCQKFSFFYNHIPFFHGKYSYIDRRHSAVSNYEQYWNKT